MPDLRRVIPADRPTRLLAAATLVNTFGNGLLFTVGAGSLVAGAALVLDVRAGYLALILVHTLTFLGAVVLIARLPHQAPVRRAVPASRGTEEVRPAALALRTSGWLVLAACVVFAASAGPGPLAAVALLLLGALIHVVGEMRQSPGGWGVAFGLAPDALQGQYHGLLSTSMAASHAIGPLLMTALLIAFGTAGWVALGLVVVAVSVASVPVADWGLRTRSMAV